MQALSLGSPFCQLCENTNAAIASYRRAVGELSSVQGALLVSLAKLAEWRADQRPRREVAAIEFERAAEVGDGFFVVAAEREIVAWAELRSQVTGGRSVSYLRFKALYSSLSQSWQNGEPSERACIVEAPLHAGSSSGRSTVRRGARTSGRGRTRHGSLFAFRTCTRTSKHCLAFGVHKAMV
jgi:hypothetical protein